MAIYHLSTKPISRSSGRSAVASVAYRAGIKIQDERLGKTYDYTKRNGVLWTGLAMPHGFNIDRNELWNRAEKTETRSNSRTAREIIINIPHELMQGDQSAGKMLAYEFGAKLSSKYGIAVDIAVHAPDKQGDNRNYHAHLLLTTRQLEQDQQGHITLGKKSQLEMSNAQLKQAGLLSNQDELKQIRKEWADLANEYLAEHNIDVRIDHRSHKDRGLDTLPTVKMGWQATELERKGIRTDVGDQNRAIKAYNAQLEQRQHEENSLKKQQKPNQEPPISTQKEKDSQTHPQKPSPNATETPKLNKNNQSNRDVPDNVLEWLKTQSRKNFNIGEVKEILKKAEQQVNELAKSIFEQQKQSLVKKSKSLLEQIEQQKAKEPLFFGKDKWKTTLDKTIDEYKIIKEKFDTLKNNGVTEQHQEQALERLEQQYPREIKLLRRMEERLEQYKQEQQIKIAKSYGADLLAQAGQHYHGKIIKVTDKGIYQETKQGTVLHMGLKAEDFSVGKSYSINYTKDGKQAEVQQDIEIRTRTSKSQDRHKGRD